MSLVGVATSHHTRSLKLTLTPSWLLLQLRNFLDNDGLLITKLFVIWGRGMHNKRRCKHFAHLGRCESH